MKYLFIVLSLLLLSYSTFGQVTGVLYKHETASGSIWETFGDGKVQPKYKGEIMNGKMHGIGFTKYPSDGKSVIGEWKNGKEWNTKHTRNDGTFLGNFENGDWIVIGEIVYLGYRNGEIGFYNEKWEGLESEKNKDIREYDGEPKKGCSLGIVDSKKKKKKYSGELKYGEYNGQSELTTLDGEKYTVIMEGLFSGQGKTTKPNGYIYEGGFSFGWKSGQGTEIFSDGRKYVGKFKLNKQNGAGIKTYPDGTKYEGTFIDGKFNGDIKITFPDGTKYYGEGINGKIKGYGKYSFADGIKFRGKYFKYVGIKSWTGHTYLTDGSEFIGDWKSGKPWNGTFYFKNRIFKGEFVNGLEQK